MGDLFGNDLRIIPDLLDEAFWWIPRGISRRGCGMSGARCWTVTKAIPESGHALEELL